MQTETQPEKTEGPSEPPKSVDQRYREILSKPEHKRTAQEKAFAKECEGEIEAKRLHGSLISRITDRALAFQNTEQGRVRRRITDMVAKVAPEANALTDRLRRERKTELEGLEKERRKAIKALNNQYDTSKASIVKSWDDAIIDAQKGVKTKMDQYEIDLKEALEEVRRTVDTFLSLLQTMDDSQLEKLLEGETVTLGSGDSKEPVTLPGA